MTYRNIAIFDQALDFAYAYQRTIPFCRKMVRYFSVFGTLTETQVVTLLKIKAEYIAKTRGL